MKLEPYVEPVKAKEIPTTELNLVELMKQPIVEWTSTTSGTVKYNIDNAPYPIHIDQHRHVGYTDLQRCNEINRQRMEAELAYVRQYGYDPYTTNTKEAFQEEKDRITLLKMQALMEACHNIPTGAFYEQFAQNVQTLMTNVLPR